MEQKASKHAGAVFAHATAPECKYWPTSGSPASFRARSNAILRKRSWSCETYPLHAWSRHGARVCGHKPKTVCHVRAHGLIAIARDPRGPTALATGRAGQSPRAGR
eukprot:9996964-Alexandrium_andersonii.AAC.1